jgi:pimeloyl-ACP methyl ester carboxylesterase
MNVFELGNRGPIVLLLHGIPSAASDLMPLGEALAAKHRVLIPELPGYGASPSLGDFSFDRIGEALAAMVRERGNAPVRAIIGFSGGAYRAFDLVLRRGIQADKIVSISGLAGLEDDARARFRGFAELIRAQPAVVATADMRAMFAATMLSPTWREAHPADCDRVADWMSLIAPLDFAAELDAVGNMPDLRPSLSQLRCEVYQRVGELDPGCPASANEELVRLLPSVHLDVVPGCGHALLIEDAAATIAKIVEVVG